MGTGEPLKETKNILEYENDKQVCMSTEGPLKKKEMPRDEKGKRVRSYYDVVYTCNLGNEIKK